MAALTISKLLKQQRQKNGLTQTDLANKLSISRSAVSNWETGRNLPDLIMIDELATIYDITTDELINGKKNNQYQHTNKLIYPILSLIILITSRLIVASNPQSLLIMDCLILLIIGTSILTKFSNLKIQVPIIILNLIVFFYCAFESRILNDFSFQTTALIVSTILMCQLMNTYHNQKSKE